MTDLEQTLNEPLIFLEGKQVMLTLLALLPWVTTTPFIKTAINNNTNIIIIMINDTK